MKEYDVILASGAEQLKKRFEKLGYRVFTCEMNYDGRRMFPNADIYVRIADVEKLSGRKVIVVQSCTGSGPSESEFYTTSDRVVELLLILSILNDPKGVNEVGHKQYESFDIEPPKQVDVVLTFQPFALQDKAFKTGEAVSSRWALYAIADQCDKIWIVNPHAPESIDWVRELIKKDELEIIDVTPDLIKFGAEKFCYDDYVVVTPDEGGQERFSCEGFGKKRSNSYAVELSGELDVKGKNVIVIDDLTKSGSTLLETKERLLNLGAKSVGMAVVHVLPLIEKGEQLLVNLIAKSKARIVTTNTIYTHVFCQAYPHLSYNIVDSLVKIFNGQKQES